MTPGGHFFLPLMNSPTFVTQGYRDRPVFTQVEVVAAVMVIRRDPSDPHASRVLTSKDPDRVVVLGGRMRNLVRPAVSRNTVHKKFGSGYRGDTTVVHSSAFLAVPHRSQRVPMRRDSVGFMAWSG